MRIRLLYSDDCPNWTEARSRLRRALDETGHPEEPVECVRVTTEAEAQALSFKGSPTILIDGADPFPATSEGTGLSCRIYRTPQGFAGAPTTSQLASAIATLL